MTSTPILDSQNNPFIDWDRWEETSRQTRIFNSERRMWFVDEVAWSNVIHHIQMKITGYTFMLDHPPNEADEGWKIRVTDKIRLWKERMNQARYN